jgi:nitrilase
MTVDGPEMAKIRKAARDANIHVVIGFSERDKASLYLAQTFISNTGGILLHRRKLKPTHVERTIYGDGQGLLKTSSRTILSLIIFYSRQHLQCCRHAIWQAQRS